METIDIIRGLLASMLHCPECGAPATRVSLTLRAYARCDACPCPDPHDICDAPAIRAAVRVVAEAEARPAGHEALALVLRRAAGQILGYSDRFNDEHGFTLGDIAACMRAQLESPPQIEWARRAADGARAWLAVYATIAPEPEATADTDPAPAVDGGAA